MGELTSKFTRDDLQMLIEAIGDWEAVKTQDYFIMQQIKDAPLPPDEESEVYQFWKAVKDSFRQREQQIIDNRNARQETAVFLKAKLMLARKDLNIGSLFEMPIEMSASTPTPKRETPKAVGGVAVKEALEKSFQQRLEIAEFFIRDLGVWEHYQKFLEEKKSAGSE